MDFFFIALIAAFISFVSTFFVKKIALFFNIVDTPSSQRKIHKKSVPLLGGLSLYISFLIVVLCYAFFRPDILHVITDVQVQPKHIVGILLGGFILVLGGILDDVFRFRPRTQIIWPIFAILAIIASGIGVEVLSNPFGGVIHLDSYKILIVWWNDLPRYISVFADTLTFFWLLGAIYTTKLLDGLDGLVSGITVIGMTIIALISMFFFVNYPTAVLATMGAGIFAGFLVWNFYPAKVFLGESGSTFAGYLLGVFAIVSGAKFATLVLILCIPILDIVWVIARRIFIEKKSPFSADRKHLHFRLLDSGFTHRGSVLILYFFSASFGTLALFLQSRQKLYAFGMIVVLMVAGCILLVKRQRKLGKVYQ